MDKLLLPASPEELAKLRINTQLLLSGTLYAARDAAHRRLCEALDRGQPLPVALSGQAIYYTGPCPAKKGRPIGSCGPTTSGRMDVYAPRLTALGVLVTIGKGERSPAVIDACMRYGAVYLAAAGGAGALYARCVKRAEVVAYPELEAEAIYRLTVEDFPVTVAVDTLGNDLYSFARTLYKETL